MAGGVGQAAAEREVPKDGGQADPGSRKVAGLGVGRTAEKKIATPVPRPPVDDNQSGGGGARAGSLIRIGHSKPIGGRS